MGDTFDTNLLSQVTALSGKLSVSRERVSLFRKARENEHKKGGPSSKAQPPEEQPAEADHPRRDGPEEGKIDITI